MNQNNFDLLNDLNYHLIIHILSYLNITDICKLEQTNNKMKLLINEYQNVIWDNFYKVSKYPQVIIHNDNFNYKFQNYTFSINCNSINIRDKYKMAINAHKNYLDK